MAKGESLMGEVATDWMDSECPEAKRLKVLPISLTLSSSGSQVGMPWSAGRPRGVSSLSIVTAPDNCHICVTSFFLMRLCCLVGREGDLLQVTCVDGSYPSPSGSSSHRFLFLGSPYNKDFSACGLQPPCRGQTTLSQRSHFIYPAY